MPKEIKLTRGLVALVDDEDFYELSKHKWLARVSSYTIANGEKRFRAYAVRCFFSKKDIFLHRLVTNCPDGMEVDHINGNTLDCRKENLRIVTHYQNSINTKTRSDNTSGYRCVCKTKRGNWYAYITANGKRKFLGVYDTKEEAARAYDRAAIGLHGEFAKLNFPRSDYLEPAGDQAHGSQDI
jgi:AP2 domain.